jgi:ribosome-binding factor A
MPTSRMRRVNEVIREVIGAAITTQLQDPRIGFVTITAVDTSPDLRHARVHVSVLGDEDEREATLEALRSSHGVLQAAVNDELRLKRTPALSFHYDESIERADRITRMLREDDDEDAGADDHDEDAGAEGDEEGGSR